MARRIVVFDLETRKGPEDLSSDIQKGWDLIREGKGGISVLAIYDYVENWTFFYDDHEILDIAAHLESADTVVGFNSAGFDVPVIEGLLGRSLTIPDHIDLCSLTKDALLAAGHRPRRGENTLGAISLRTLKRGKIDKGEHAPVLAAEGRWGRLVRYCADDVRLTRDLFEYIRAEGGVVSPNNTFLPVELPDYLRGGGLTCPLT